MSILRRALVLGGTGDIGSAIVRKFSKEGYEVRATQKSELNLSKPEEIEKFFSKNLGEFDVLIHAAGWNEPKPHEEVNLEMLQKSLQINTLGFFQVVQKIAPQMKVRKEGHILAISSLYGSFSRLNRLPYVTSKHALNGMMKTLALELGRSNIKVNTLSPGFVDTKMTRKNNSPEIIRSFEDRTALRRLATVEDIAEVSYFLCSPQNQYLHGQDIIVDGGYSIGGFQNL